jgi:hypothetical protein
MQDQSASYLAAFKQMGVVAEALCVCGPGSVQTLRSHRPDLPSVYAATGGLFRGGVQHGGAGAMSQHGSVYRCDDPNSRH